MRILTAIALLSAVACVHAQTPATVNVVTPTACITSIDGVPTANGTITVYAPGKNSAAAPFTSTTGLVLSGIAQRPIAGGQIVGSLTLPNPAVTSPVNVGYTFTIQDNTARTSTTYASVFITPDGSGNWNICSLQAGNYQTAFPTVFTGSSFQGGNVPNATSFASTVTLSADPTANLQAATKQYVDDHSSPFTGGTVPNATTFQSTVALAADPTTSLQAATKQYVDAHAGGGTTISNVNCQSTDAATIVCTWTTSPAADSLAYCGGQAGVANGTEVGVTAHTVVVTGLIATSTYACHVVSAGVSSAVQNVKTLSPVTRTPILTASMGSVTSTAYTGDSLNNFLSSDGVTYVGIDDTASPGPSASQSLSKITNESTMTMSSVNGMSNYGGVAATNGTDGPGGAALTYKQSGLFGMNGCLYMFGNRDLYSTGGTVPQTVYFGNIIADDCNHGATWNNHQTPATYGANGSPDGPGISMFTDSVNQAWCTPVRYAGDDGTMGYLTPGNEIDGANGYVYANCTDGQWNNSSHLWMVRVPRANLATLTAGNAWQWWCGPASPTPADFVNPGNWSYASACKVSIYTAANQVSAADEVFLPGFNSYVLAEWYQPTTGTSNNTVWNFLSGPTPAGPWSSFFTQTFNPPGWYNPAFLHRPIANNTSSASVTADVLFTGDYNTSMYYHPSYAAMTLQFISSQTLGNLPTNTASFGAQYVGIVNAQFVANGHLTSFTTQEFSAYSGPIDIGVCTNNGGGNYTVTAYVTVNLAATTSPQTFNAPGDFTAPATTAGEWPCFYAPGGNGPGKTTSGGNSFLYAGPFGSIPVGSQPYTGAGPGNGVFSLQETISIP